MKKYFVLIAILMSCVTTLSSQTQVIALPSNGPLPDGITYNLPLTTLVIHAEAVQTVEKPGPFYKYAERFLGTTDFISESKSEWALTEVNVHYRTEADPAKSYLVVINKKTTASNIQLTDKGVIRSVNKPINTKFPKTNLVSSKVVDAAIKFDLSQLGEEALVSSSIPKMAEMAAKQIYRIRESRTNLLSGENEHLPDGVSLTLMLQKLDASESELVALFVGKRISVPASRNFFVTPTESLTNHIAFRISTLAGIVDADNLLGKPIYLSVTPLVRENSFKPRSSQKTCGIYYNIPATAIVVVADGTAVLAEKTMTMPQFGTVACLPAAMFDQMCTKVEFTEFGAIKLISK